MSAVAFRYLAVTRRDGDPADPVNRVLGAARMRVCGQLEAGAEIPSGEPPDNLRTLPGSLGWPNARARGKRCPLHQSQTDPRGHCGAAWLRSWAGYDLGWILAVACGPRAYGSHADNQRTPYKARS